MARWRRLKRRGSSLMRRNWRVEVSTKGEKLVWDVRLLKCPYYMRTTETQGGENVMVLAVGESATAQLMDGTIVWERGRDGYTMKHYFVYNENGTRRTVEVTEFTCLVDRGDAAVAFFGTRVRQDGNSGEILSIEKMPGWQYVGMIPVTYEQQTTAVVNVERIDATDDPDIPAGVDFKPGI